MKTVTLRRACAFSLLEVLIATSIAGTILAITLTSSVALQKSLNQINDYSATHMQQIRIVDYLARDVRRGLSVISSVDRQTVTIAIPKYVYQAGDVDLPNAALIGTPRVATRAYLAGSDDPNVNYGDTTNTVVYRVQGNTIVRTQDGILTTIASSTDKIIPETTDIELSNTEYTTTGVTFEPISLADRNGTVIYSTSYLRNRRRPPPSPTPSPSP